MPLWLIWHQLLLTVHVLSAIFWLGGTWRGIPFKRRIRRARGTPLEIPLLLAEMGPGRFNRYFIGLLVISGILLSIETGQGFFQTFWLGVKQGIMVALLIGIAYTRPISRQVREALEAIPANPGLMPDSVRVRLDYLWRVRELIDVGVIVNVILAVWKPS